jgi:hypothetical protein
LIPNFARGTPPHAECLMLEGLYVGHLLGSVPGILRLVCGQWLFNKFGLWEKGFYFSNRSNYFYPWREKFLTLLSLIPERINRPIGTDALVKDANGLIVA